MLTVQPGPCGSNDHRLGRKMGKFQMFLVQGTGGSPRVPDPENAVGNQDIGSPGRPVSSGLQVHSEQEHCLTRSIPPW